MRLRRTASALVVALGMPVATMAIAACDRANAAAPAARHRAEQAGTQSYRYVDPKRVGSYPSSYPTIQGWINAGNMTQIRRHGWDIWASITAPTPYSMPTWQTWFSGHELFEMDGTTRLNARSKRGLLRIQVTRGFNHLPRARQADGIPVDTFERVFAFNRFSYSTARYITMNRLNQAQTLKDTNDAFTKRGTPLASRAILVSRDSTDSMSFVLKPVFQFISGSEVTAVPYWAGDSSAVTTDSANPIASTWNRAVAVDPSGKYKAGDSVYLPVNNAAARWLKVVPLSAFYWVKVTKEDSANFTSFGAVNGDLIGLANDTSLQAVLNAARPGNIGLLMAMHVTGKEIPNWTWQSFWWAYNPNDPQFGADRPKSIPAPWNHYNMTVAYFMTQNNRPYIAFNPYLETSLAGKIPAAGPTGDSISWTGVTSNCMSCHRRAAIAYVDGQFVLPPYGPAMFVNAGDPQIFTQPLDTSKTGRPRYPVLKTDFLWSVAIRAAGAPPPTAQPKTKK